MGQLCAEHEWLFRIRCHSVTDEGIALVIVTSAKPRESARELQSRMVVHRLFGPIVLALWLAVSSRTQFASACGANCVLFQYWVESKYTTMTPGMEAAPGLAAVR